MSIIEYWIYYELICSHPHWNSLTWVHFQSLPLRFWSNRSLYIKSTNNNTFSVHCICNILYLFIIVSNNLLFHVARYLFSCPNNNIFLVHCRTYLIYFFLYQTIYSFMSQDIVSRLREQVDIFHRIKPVHQTLMPWNTYCFIAVNHAHLTINLKKTKCMVSLRLG